MERVAVILNSLQEKEQYFREALESLLDQKGIELTIILSTVTDDPCLEWFTHTFRKDSTVVRKFNIINKDKHTGKSPEGSFMQLNSAIETHLMDNNDYDWFCFASSNDVLLPEKMITEIDACKEQSKIQYTRGDWKTNHASEIRAKWETKLVGYSNLTRVDENLQGLKQKTKVLGEYSYQKHIGSNFVPDTSMIHRTILQKYAPFAMKWKNMGYYDFWLRVYEGEGNVFAYTNVSNYLYRQTPESMHAIRSNDKEDKKNVGIAKRRMIGWHQDKGGLYNADGTLPDEHMM